MLTSIPRAVPLCGPPVVPSMVAAGLILVTGCAPSSVSRTSDPCAALDSTMEASAFIVVTAPTQAARVRSPFRLRGCSRTFESNVVWELHARDGRLLASGHATGGGVDGPAPFDAGVEFTIAEPEVGRVVVFEIDASDGEGFPPPRVVFSVVLEP